MSTINTVDALQSLTPRAQWVRRSDELEWLDTEQTQPTDLEITTEITRLQDIYDSLEYSRLRQVEYAKRNQDEMRYNDAKNNTNLWIEWQDQIKLDIPKVKGDTV